jgi:hypothetical protein
MNWRDLLIGAALTLIVTVIGGVIVYVITRETPRQPDLYYRAGASATFGGNTTTLSFASVEFGNNGKAVAEGVRLFARTKSGQPIRDKRIEAAPALVTDIRDRSTENSLDLTIPRLLPGESVRVAVLIGGPEGLKNLTVRSTTAIGQPIINNDDDDKSKFGLVLLVILALLSIQSLLIVFRKRLLIKIGLKVPASDDDRNNAAFVLLHTGLDEKAGQILDNILSSGTPGPYSLANSALVDALAGHNETADSAMDAALWWADTHHKDKHATAVVLFTRAIIKLHRGDNEGGKADLRSALDLSGEQIASYCRMSKHILGRAEVLKRELADVEKKWPRNALAA